MSVSRRALSYSGLAAATGGLISPAVRAQASWPQGGPIRLVVPFAAGGAADFVARLFASEMSKSIGQTIVVDPRPGAGATIGTGQVARAAPDGYTLILAVISGMVVGKILYGGRITWNPDADFAQIGMLMGTPYMLLVRSDSPIRTLGDLVAEAKAKPDNLSYGSAGIGSMPHLVGYRFCRAAGIEMQHVPYRGVALAMTDVLAGIVPVLVDSPTSAAPHIQSGMLRPLVHTWFERMPEMPNVPTFRESGYPDLVVDGWTGLAAPARTPRPILEKLADAVRAALASPDVQRQLAERSSMPGRLFLDDAQRYVRDELAAWTPVIRESGATPD